MKIVFRTDSSRLIGTGHVMRCLTLAKHCRERGDDVAFICRDHQGNISELLEQQGFNLLRLPCSAESASDSLTDQYASWLGVPWESDAEQSQAAIRDSFTRVGWLVVDHYALDHRWQNQLRSVADHIMVIDDLANRRHDCEILLDQNLYENLEKRYDGLVPSGCRTMLGPRFAMLRPEFMQYRRQLPERSGEIRRVLLFFGGADVTNETAKALDAVKLLKRDDLTLEVIVGRSNRHVDEIERRCADMKKACFHCQVDNMAALMASCDLAIGGGGTTTWERCCLGLPCITIAVAENQVEVARMASKTGFARFLGRSSEVTTENVSDALKQMMSDPASVRRMTQAGLDVVNADGVELVASSLANRVAQSTARMQWSGQR